MSLGPAVAKRVPILVKFKETANQQGSEFTNPFGPDRLKPNPMPLLLYSKRLGMPLWGAYDDSCWMGFNMI